MFGWLLILFWGWYVVDNSITDWLLDKYARKGQEDTFYILTRVHDFVVNFVLAIPVALMLQLVIGKRDWKAVWITVISFHVVSFWGAEFSNFGLLFRFWGFWINLITTLVVIPLAYLMIAAIRGPKSVG